MRTTAKYSPVLVLVIAVVFWNTTTVAAQTWRGLTVEPESRCSPYVAAHYGYPQSVELDIIERLGGLWSPYTGETFASRRQTDIEHILARSEAHDSGLCAADRATRQRFATDPLNLTLASPHLNREEKAAFDAAEWMPPRNRCWFTDRVIRVRLKYALTIDQSEVDALDAVLGSCESVMLVREDQGADAADGLPGGVVRWDDNQNGRISCAEARRHGIAPVRRGHPAYPYTTDRDNDGTACE